MKPTLIIVLATAGLLATGHAEPDKKPTEAEKAKALVKHQEGSDQLSVDQDKQAGDVQELVAEQANPKVIELLKQVEILMAQATDRLEDADTGGDTIAMQTEIIEKIYEAAKAKSQ